MFMEHLLCATNMRWLLSRLSHLIYLVQSETHYLISWLFVDKVSSDCKQENLEYVIS